VLNLEGTLMHTRTALHIRTGDTPPRGVWHEDADSTSGPVVLIHLADDTLLAGPATLDTVAYLRALADEAESLADAIARRCIIGSVQQGTHP
jgi:hypothetical protein